MSVEPGEWQEHDGTPSLTVQHVGETEVEIFVEDKPEDFEEHQFVGIILNSEQARSVALKLLELADSIDGEK